MYTDIHALLAVLFIVGGLVALAWSADRFVDGAAGVARWLGISPFIIGMVIIGFGTCAPEFFVSLFSGATGHASLSLGNAYGSCIFNIAGILGVSALVAPLVVRPTLSFVGGPLLSVISVVSYLVLRDGALQYADSWLLLGLFFVLMPLYCWYDQRKKSEGDEDGTDTSSSKVVANWRMAFDLVIGLAVMVGASHLLVWGSVDVARALGVSELVIGLTIVAIGTSVPELATSVVAARKGESELVLGNIVGSNLFNMLCVVGTAGAASGEGIAGFSKLVVSRDLPLMLLASLSVIAFGANWRRPRENGRVSRLDGAIWILAFIAYLAVAVYQEILNNG